jgi:hypothetical protein
VASRSWAFTRTPSWASTGGATDAIDVLNAKSSRRVVLDAVRELGRYRYTVRDSQGRTTDAGEVALAAGPRAFTVPVSAPPQPRALRRPSLVGASGRSHFK